MHQWQSVYENTFNALHAMLFTGHHKRTVCVIIWKDPEIKLSRELTPYTVPYPREKYLHLYVPSTI